MRQITHPPANMQQNLPQPAESDTPVRAGSIRESLPPTRPRWFGFWDLLGVSIALAGGAYPLVLLVIVWIVGALQWCLGFFQGGFMGLTEAANAAAFHTIAGVMLAGICLMYAGMACVVCLPCVAGSLRLMQWNPRLPQLGAFCGGLVAFVCFQPFLSQDEMWRNPTGVYFTLYYLGGPALAILCGQVAGARAGVETEQDRRVRGLPKHEHRLKFSVMQMLVVTLLASLLLSVLRLSGLLNAWLVGHVGFWIVWQTITMYPIVRLAQWRRRIRDRNWERKLAGLEACVEGASRAATESLAAPQDP